MSDLGEITVCYTMTFRRRTPHSAATLWRNVTDAAEVTAWMGRPATIDLRVGGAYFVQFPPGAGALDGVIVRLEPERRIAYVWGLSVLEWTIEPRADGSGCDYTFTHHGQPPGAVPNEGGIAAGWHAWLDAYDGHVDGAPFDPDADRATAEKLAPTYLTRIREVIGGAG